MDRYNDFFPDRPMGQRGTPDFMRNFGRMVVAQLFLDRRLSATAQVGSLDYESNPPQNGLQALHLHPTAENDLQVEIKATFGKGVWIDRTRGNLLCFRVSEDGEIPSPADQLRPHKMRDQRLLEDEGDGLKSYMGICLALLLGQRPVCLIDEPEMCLHPPQAYRLGRFIGTYGASKDRLTMVATHSSHVLRGIIDATTELQIVRLTRNRAAFEARLISPASLAEAFHRPAVRSELILDGIFSESVAIVEAEGTDSYTKRPGPLLRTLSGKKSPLWQ